MDQGKPQEPHILIFPLPLQGHVNSMLKLAELLCLAGLHVTFLVSDHTHSRLLHHSDVHSRFSRHPGNFCFETFSDGIPPENPRSGAGFLNELIISLNTTINPLFRDLLLTDRLGPGGGQPPVTCIIADGVMSFALDVGEETGIPVIYFRTIGACSFWCYFRMPELVESGELPFAGNNLDLPIQSVPGMEGFLRRRDLPSLCRVSDSNDPGFRFVLTETKQTTRARGLILNTFEDLEGPGLSQIRSQIPNVYTVGPLHAHLKQRLMAATPPFAASSNSLWEEDRSGMTWLESQPVKSVIYVSFGSITALTREQLLEFWHGLVRSGKRFLWALRPECIAGVDGQVPTELLEETRERGCIVGWVRQEEVLAHWAVGGFLTHSGWNSTLESIEAAVPMICWPYFMDQQVNSRVVGSVWKVGLDMKDTCDRFVIERMINEVMDDRRDEFIRRAEEMAKLTRESISKGGSSYSNLERLIQDIKSMAC